MKKTLSIIAFLLLCFTSQAADLKLAWDQMPAGQAWKFVRVYEKVGADYIKVAEVSGTATDVTFSTIPGTHTYIARSVDGWESSDSNEVSTALVPSAPQLKITITIVVQ